MDGPADPSALALMYERALPTLVSLLSLAWIYMVMHNPHPISITHLRERAEPVEAW